MAFQQMTLVFLFRWMFLLFLLKYLSVDTHDIISTLPSNCMNIPVDLQALSLSDESKWQRMSGFGWCQFGSGGWMSKQLHYPYCMLPFKSRLGSRSIQDSSKTETRFLDFRKQRFSQHLFAELETQSFGYGSNEITVASDANIKPAFKSISFKSITSLSSFLELCMKYEAATLAPWEVALALNHLGRLVQKSNETEQVEVVRKLFRTYQQRLVPHVDSIDAKNLAWILNGAKHVVLWNARSYDIFETRSFLNVIGSRILAITNIDVLNLSIFLNAFTTLAELNNQFVPESAVICHLEAEVCMHGQSSYQSYSQATSTILNSFVRLGNTKSRVFPHLSKIVQNSSLSTYSIRSLSLIAHAYSRIFTSDETIQEYLGIMKFVSLGVLRTSPSLFNPHDISSLSSAFARSKFSSHKVFNHLFTAASFTTADSWGNQAIANTMNAFSAVGFNCSKLMVHMASIALHRAESHSKILPKHLAMVLNALTRLEIFDEDLFRRFSYILLREQQIELSNSNDGSYYTESRVLRAKQVEARNPLSELAEAQATLLGRDVNDGTSAVCLWSAVEVCTVAQSFAKVSAQLVDQSGSVTNIIKHVGNNGQRQLLMTAHFTRVAELVLTHLAGISLRISRQDWLGPDGKGQAAASMINALAKLGLRHDALLQHLADSLVHGLRADPSRARGSATRPQLSQQAGALAAVSAVPVPEEPGLDGRYLSQDWDWTGPEARAADAALTNLAQAVHGLASLNVQHAPFMEALSGLVCGCREEELSGQVLANVAWSLAVLDEDGVHAAAHARIAAAIRGQFDRLLQGRDVVVSRADLSAADGAADPIRPPPATRIADTAGPARGSKSLSGRLDNGSRAKAGTPLVSVAGGAAAAWAGDGRRPASVVDLAEVRQVYQYMLSWRVAARLGRRADWLDEDERRLAVARSVFQARSRNRGAASRLQRQVGETLRGMGLRVRVECVEPESGYSVDMLVEQRGREDRRHSGPDPGGSEWGQPVLVEVDGPRHFALPQLRQPLGNTLLKRRQLRALGARLVSVPFWDWPADAALDARRAYLAARLRNAA